MKYKKRILLSLSRKKDNLLLLGLLFFLALFLGVIVSIYNTSRNNIWAIEKTYGTNFSIELILNQSDPNVWENRVLEGIDTTVRAYIGPIVDEQLVGKIAEEVEGITDFEAGGRVCVMLDEYESIPGYWNWSYEYFSTHENNLPYEIEEAKNFMHITECWHLRNSFRYEQFYNGAFRLVEGRHITPTDTFKCIISKAFAQKNDLKIGDTLKIKLPSLNVRATTPVESLGTVETEIVGFFETTYQQAVGEYTRERDILENWVIADNATGYALYDLFESDYALSISQFYVENSEDLDEVMNKVKALDWIDWQYFELVKDDSTYKEAVKPLRIMKTIMLISLLLVLITGVLLLYLVITYSMRKRIHETGILMSLGFTGKEIRKQFIGEHLFIGILAFLLAFVVSFAVTPVIGEQIYGTINKEKEQKIYTDEEIEAAIARGEQSKINEMAKNQKTGVEPPKTIETKVTAMTILVVFVIMMLIIYWSVNTVIKKTLKMEPMSILSMIR